MLALVARQQSALRLLLPAASQAAYGLLLQQERGLKILEIFSKESRAKRKAALKEEMQHGYFDDFRSFRDSKGKVWASPERLVPAGSAPSFPRMEVVQTDGSTTTFPPAAAAGAAEAGSSNGAELCSSSGSAAAATAAAGQPAAASLVCVAFRAGAQPMLEAWAAPFSQRFQSHGDVALYELAIVEGVVMKLWPFRSLLLRSGAASNSKYAMPCRHLHHFGDFAGLREALHLTNLLTGYVFLVDAAGRLRWRGSGTPSEPELQTLLRCTEELLRQSEKQLGTGQQ